MSSLGSGASPSPPSDATWVVTVLALLGKLGVSAGWQIIFLWESELYPTEVRLQGIGFTAITSRIGGIIAPYILDIFVSRLTTLLICK